MSEQDSKIRSRLLREAHHLKPVVMIGKEGLTPEVVAAVEKALEDHELIKVKFLDFKEEKKAISQDIATRLEAFLVRIIGNIAIFYKQNPG